MPKIISLHKPDLKAARELAAKISASGVRPRLTFLFPLGAERTAAMELLAESHPSARKIRTLLSSSDEPVLLAALHCALKSRGGGLKKAIEALCAHPSNAVKRLAENRLAIISGRGTPALGAGMWSHYYHESRPPKRRWLLSSRKALFATDQTDQLLHKLKTLEEISRALASEFGEDFVGLAVRGGIAKGYSTEQSDADAAIVGFNKTGLMASRAHELGEKRGLRMEMYRADPAKKPVNDSLFRGLFFGDHERLFQLQKRAVDAATPKEWEELVARSTKFESDVTKTILNFHFSPNELLELSYAARLLRVPPDLEKMREIMKDKASSKGINS